MLFPEDLKDYSGYKAYFYSRKKWFFSVVALTYVLDIFDSVLKKSSTVHHLGTGIFSIRRITHSFMRIGYSYS
ncbi:MAG: hypothetical protein H7259_01880 [Cytophagales bacterium]|nr:hypothetical protein [Cytophaga sp.]